MKEKKSFTDVIKINRTIKAFKFKYFIYLKCGWSQVMSLGSNLGRLLRLKHT